MASEGALHETLCPLCLLLMESEKPHVLAVRGDPLDEHIAHVIGRSFAKVSSSDSCSSAFKVIRDRAEKTPIFFNTEQHCSYNCDFKMLELKTALSQCRNTSPGPDGSLYVDDLQISCQGSSLHLIERQLQIAINNILTWCEHNGHTISPNKSCVVHFCRKRGLHPDPDLYIGNQLIPVVNEVRFLGICFDRKLTFLSHILYLRKRCERLLNILKVLSNTSWKAGRTSLLRIYESVILPRIDYGCVVCGSACASNLKKIDPLRHSALRICSGAFRTSPIDSLYVECFQMPLSLRSQKLSINYYFKVMSVFNHLLSSQHVSKVLTRLYNARPSKIPPFLNRTMRMLHDTYLDGLQVQKDVTFHHSPWNIPFIQYTNPFARFNKNTTAPVVLQHIFYYYRCQYSDYITIFTDGSTADGHVGFGVLLMTPVTAIFFLSFVQFILQKQWQSPMP
ncbi:hypothetical protein AVEN_223834-1 [Araneus ventricosus]|uniref:Reverse transcriptase domain-containing protein n=1 Tax=Araneus ventricosus TaxID=182803 RepID=A0A4Y2FFV8_ARAVE|nr:hypothetical protein AVEN_223834-1 [Araneus ventricosus]